MSDYDSGVECDYLLDQAHFRPRKTKKKCCKVNASTTNPSQEASVQILIPVSQETSGTSGQVTSVQYNFKNVGHLKDEYIRKEIETRKLKIQISKFAQDKQATEVEIDRLKSENAYLIVELVKKDVENEWLKLDVENLKQEVLQKNLELQDNQNSLGENLDNIFNDICGTDWAANDCSDDISVFQIPMNLKANEAVVASEAAQVPIDIPFVDPDGGEETKVATEPPTLACEKLCGPEALASQSPRTEASCTPGRAKRRAMKMHGPEFPSTSSTLGKKAKAGRKSRSRVVEYGYFFWTDDKNIRLVSAMISALEERENLDLQLQPKEEEFLDKVYKGCDCKFPLNKIRHNVNNLVRRYLSHSNKRKLKDLKADPLEYKNLLITIRTLLKKKQETGR